MKRVRMATPEYESPQTQTIQFITEQTVLAGSSSLDDMIETDGEWAI